jgi:hypothetical protein
MRKAFPSDLADEILSGSTTGDANIELIAAVIREPLVHNGRKQTPVVVDPPAPVQGLPGTNRENLTRLGSVKMDCETAKLTRASEISCEA